MWAAVFCFVLFVRTVSLTGIFGELSAFRTSPTASTLEALIRQFRGSNSGIPAGFCRWDMGQYCIFTS